MTHIVLLYSIYFTQLSFFWTVTAIQLCFLSRTLPNDEDAMNAELAQYAKTAMLKHDAPSILSEDDDMVSIEDRMISFDGSAARESFRFVGVAIREISEEIRLPFHCVDDEDQEEEEDDDDDDGFDVERKRKLWIQQQQQNNTTAYQNCEDELLVADENTLLLPLG